MLFLPLLIINPSPSQFFTASYSEDFVMCLGLVIINCAIRMRSGTTLINHLKYSRFTSKIFGSATRTMHSCIKNTFQIFPHSLNPRAMVFNSSGGLLFRKCFAWPVITLSSNPGSDRSIHFLRIMEYKRGRRNTQESNTVTPIETDRIHMLAERQSELD